MKQELFMEHDKKRFDVQSRDSGFSGESNGCFLSHKVQWGRDFGVNGFLTIGDRKQEESSSKYAVWEKKCYIMIDSQFDDDSKEKKTGSCK